MIIWILFAVLANGQGHGATYQTEAACLANRAALIVEQEHPVQLLSECLQAVLAPPGDPT